MTDAEFFKFINMFEKSKNQITFGIGGNSISAEAIASAKQLLHDKLILIGEGQASLSNLVVPENSSSSSHGSKSEGLFNYFFKVFK